MKLVIGLIAAAVVLGAGVFFYRRMQPDVPLHPAPVAVPEPKSPGRQGRVFAGHTGPVRSLDFSPDSASLASSSDDGTVRFWDLSSGEPKQSLAIPGGPIPAVAFSPDGKVVAIGRYDSKAATSIYLHPFAAGRTEPASKTLTDEVNLISSLAFSSDGKFLAASVGPTVDVWDVDSGARKFALEAGVNSSSAISPGAGSLLTGSTNENELKLWSLADGNLFRTWAGHDAGPISIQFSADGKLAASGGYDSKIILWDPPTASVKQNLSLPEADVVHVLRFSSDSRRLFAALDHHILVWDLGTALVTQSIPFETCHALAVSRDGKWLAAAGESGAIQLIPLDR